MKLQKWDELYTPPEAIYPLLKYLPKNKTYWECTDFGGSNITKILRDNGFKVVSTHLKDGFDFLNNEPKFDFDVIITNPPYSLKTDFLRKAYEMGKPFAFLLPLTSLEGKERGNIFREYGVQVLVLDKRINFLKNKNNVWYNTSWFCWKLLPKELIFERV
ncbi:MAG: tRNA (adenine-N(6)-)-methyltransferase [Bacteroidales bacterium]|nr:tRNA (adenine-N(6)-)-methyltransferase [Bacteroidales bacterium]